MAALDAASVAALVSTGQAREILDLPVHLQDALWRVESAGLSPHQASGLVIAGMGGSGIGGLLATAAIGDGATAPIVVNSGYALPGWVDDSWTVLLSSYSGATEETLSCWDQATARGAHRIVCTTGGPLAERARADGVPVVPVPGGFQPRAAVGYATVVAMEIAAVAGVAPSLAAEIDAAAAFVRERGEAWGPDAADDSAAKALARELHGRIPVVYGAGLTTAAAYRFKCQVNENANLPAFWSELPEADHNEIEGWGSGAPLAPVLFVDPEDTHPRVLTRFAETADIIGGAARVEATGASRTERLLGLVHFGDLVSLYLAVLAGNDPVEIPALLELKRRLSG